MNHARLLALVALLPLTACGTSARAAARSYSITDVSRLRISGPFDVHVHVGGSSLVRATGPQEALDRLSVEQHEETLVIQPLPGGWGGWPMGFHGNLVVDVTMPSLDQAVVTGSGETSIDKVKGDAVTLVLSGSGSLAVGEVQVTQLNAMMTGSGDLTVAGGHAVGSKAVVTGTGDLKAGGLVVDDAQTSLVSSGDLTIGARHTAKGNLAGSGDLTIVGQASCAIMRTGSGDVHCGHKAAE